MLGYFSSNVGGLAVYLRKSVQVLMLLPLILLVQFVCLFVFSRTFQRLLSQIFYQASGHERVTMWLMAGAFLPGTFIHELSHLVVARLLLVRAGHLTLLPHRQENRLVMGSVLIPQTDKLRMFFYRRGTNAGWI